MNATQMAHDAARCVPEKAADADIQSALNNLKQGSAHRALAVFAEAFRDGVDLPGQDVASVMIEVARALIWVFEFDRKSPAAYHFLRTVGREAADIIAQLLELANFPVGNEDPAARDEPIMLAYAGSLSVAGRHAKAIGVLARLLEKSPDQPALSHAMAVAQRLQAGLSDDLLGPRSALSMKTFVLNLDRQPDRYESFLRRNGGCEITFERFSASDGSQMTETEVLAMGLVAPGSCFTRGAVGCGISHARIWKQVAEQGVPGLVFEDDVTIRHDISERLATLLPTLGNWDYVALGYNTDGVLEVEPVPGMKSTMTFLPRRPDDKTGALFQESKIQVAAFRLNTCFGTSGYIVSPAGARKLLQLCFPIDNRSYERTLFGQTVAVPVSGIDHMLNCNYHAIEAYACFSPLVLPSNDHANSTTRHDVRVPGAVALAAPPNHNGVNSPDKAGSPENSIRLHDLKIVKAYDKPYAASRVSLVVPEAKAEVELRLNSSDLPTFWQVFVNFEYQSPVLPPTASTIVDLGANIGLATLYFAARYPEATILSVEPDADNFGVLLRNTRSLQQRVHRYQAAVWTHDGQIGLRTEDDAHRSLGAWGVQVTAAPRPSEKNVPCYRLSTLLDLAGFSSVDILKIDIEGAELELFSEGVADCLGRIQLIIIETHDRFRPGSEAAVRKALAPLFEERPRTGENLFFARRQQVQS